MKCEHGLTTKECYVCMSPKYGKHDTKQERVAKPQVEKHMTIEVMKQALEALETCMYPQQKQIQAITSLRQAIEQAEKQEPVAWMVYTLDGKSVCVTDNPADFNEQHRALPLYTTPQPQEKNA